MKLLVAVVQLNLFAIGVFTGHTQRGLRWLARVNRALTRAVSAPWQEVFQDASDRMLPQSDFPGGLYIVAVLIIGLTAIGGFLLVVTSLG
ncbi:MAG TPA: hypothetical protein VD902_01010 [Symbiobacteriaceae bacterium]|nr:hypothetical protein [Symbiobacteriaceae bacterium]